MVTRCGSRFLAIGALALLASTAVAQSADDASSARAEPALRRILHTNDGRWLRGAAREVDGGFEVRVGERWKLVPAESIENVWLESDVMHEMRALARQVPTAPTPVTSQRTAKLQVTFARWMFAHGLGNEAFDELDRVFARDPDQRDALALVAEAAPPLELPTERAALITTGVKAHGAARELVVARLARLVPQAGDAEKNELSTDLARELASGVDARRAFATLALRRIFPGASMPGSAVKDLAVHAVVDSVFDVRKGAALALRDAQNPLASALVTRALGSNSGTLRQRAAEALGDMGYPDAIEPLVQRMVAAQSSAGSSSGRAPHANIFVGNQVAYVRDFDVQIAQAASIAKPVVGVVTEGSVLDVAVIGVTEYGPDDESIACCRSLRKLTGEPMGADAGAWQRWWAENRARFMPHANDTTTTGGASPVKRND